MAQKPKAATATRSSSNIQPKVKLHQDTSILTAELNALSHALETTSKYHNKKFAIFGDSTNAIPMDKQYNHLHIDEC